MSTTLTVTPDQSNPVQVNTCRREKCDAQFVAGSGVVPDLNTLYEQVRNGTVNTAYPLTRAEILSMEFCRSCGKDRMFEKYGVKTFSTDGTLRLMEQWAEKNAGILAQRQYKQDAWEVRQRQKRLDFALGRRDDKGFVNKTFSEAKLKVDKPRPKHRTHTHIRSNTSVPGAKKYGEMATVAKQSSKKKNKNEDNDNKKGRKGR
jgi:hypothetical protein